MKSIENDTKVCRGLKSWHWKYKPWNLGFTCAGIKLKVEPSIKEENMKILYIQVFCRFVKYPSHSLLPANGVCLLFEDKILIFPMLIKAVKLMMNSWGNIPVVGQNVSKLLWNKTRHTTAYWCQGQNSLHVDVSLHKNVLVHI